MTRLESGSVQRKLVSVVVVCLLVLGGLLVLDGATHAQQKGAQKVQKSSPASQGDVARGKYIVEGVAMCGQCHTPRDSNGNLEQNHALEGAPVILGPPNPDPNWPLKAPRIGGNPPASDEDMVKLLTTGIWTDGKPLRFPMMPFRMNEADARAVVAYLKSMTPQQ
jgi:mono/diheme cytochrome c family protein